MTIRWEKSRSLAVAAAGTVVVGCWLVWREQQQRRCRRREQQKAPTPTASSSSSLESHAFYLARAQELRLALVKPLHSQFRVVAVLVLEDGSTILGANDEPSPALGGAICAERAALLQWRLHQRMSSSSASKKPQDHAAIVRVYIVSDADTPIPPGLLCREYLRGHPAVTAQTPIILQAACRVQDAPHKPCLECTLHKLYPYPSPYNGLETARQLQRGPQIVAQLLAGQSQEGVTDTTTTTTMMTPATWMDLHAAALVRQHDELRPQLVSLRETPAVTTDDLVRLYHTAVAAAQRDNRDALHPVRYGTAALLMTKTTTTTTTATNDDEQCTLATTSLSLSTSPPHFRKRFVSARQMKALEYGATSDAVCQLLPLLFLEQQQQLQPNKPVFVAIAALLHVDHWGVPHAPFAPGRSLLTEHGWGDAPCLVLQDNNNDNDNDNDNDTTVPHQPTMVPARILAPFAPEKIF